MRHQIEQAKSAGITGFIVSWKDTPLDDLRLRLLMQVSAQEHFKLAMIYEGLDFYRHPLPASEVAAGFGCSVTSSRAARSSTGSMASR